MPTICSNLIAALVAALLANSAVAQDNHDKHMHAFAKDVDALHTVLAPLWHAPNGKERSQAICAKAQQLDDLTRAISSGDARHLQTAVVALKAQCQSRPTDVDAVFAQLHDAFHRLAEPKAH